MKVILGDFLREINEKTTKNDQYPVLTSSKSGIFLQSDYFNKQVASRDNTGYKVIRRGQFTYRAMSDTGEFFPNMLDCTDTGIVSPAYPVFEITRPDVIIPEFLKYYFKSDVFQHSIASFAQGSTRTSIKFEKLKTVSLSLPNVERQAQIIEILDKVSMLIQDRTLEIQKLDDLVKARFVELFGMDNSPTKSLNDVIVPDSSISYGIIVPGDYFEKGCPMVRPSDYKKGQLDLKNVYRVDPKIEQQYTRTRLHGDEILVQVIGQPGQIIPTTEKCRGMNVTRNLAVIRPNSQIVSREYLIEFLRSETAQCFLTGSSKQSTLKQLPLGLLKKLEVPIPPMELQMKFANFVAQIDKSKSVIQKSLVETQLLFDSLMQQYFG